MPRFLTKPANVEAKEATPQWARDPATRRANVLPTPSPFHRIVLEVDGTVMNVTDGILSDAVRGLREPLSVIKELAMLSDSLYEALSLDRSVTSDVRNSLGTSHVHQENHCHESENTVLEENTKKSAGSVVLRKVKTFLSDRKAPSKTVPSKTKKATDTPNSENQTQTNVLGWAENIPSNSGYVAYPKMSSPYAETSRVSGGNLSKSPSPIPPNEKIRPTVTTGNAFINDAPRVSVTLGDSVPKVCSPLPAFAPSLHAVSKQSTETIEEKSAEEFASRESVRQESTRLSATVLSKRFTPTSSLGDVAVSRSSLLKAECTTERIANMENEKTESSSVRSHSRNSFYTAAASSRPDSLSRLSRRIQDWDLDNASDKTTKETQRISIASFQSQNQRKNAHASLRNSTLPSSEQELFDTPMGDDWTNARMNSLSAKSKGDENSEFVDGAEKCTDEESVHWGTPQSSLSRYEIDECGANLHESHPPAAYSQDPLLYDSESSTNPSDLEIDDRMEHSRRRASKKVTSKSEKSKGNQESISRKTHLTDLVEDAEREQSKLSIKEHNVHSRLSVATSYGSSRAGSVLELEPGQFEENILRSSTHQEPFIVPDEETTSIAEGSESSSENETEGSEESEFGTEDNDSEGTYDESSEYLVESSGDSDGSDMILDEESSEEDQEKSKERRSETAQHERASRKEGYREKKSIENLTPEDISAIQLSTLTVLQLRSLLKERGCVTTGTKSQLIERLAPVLTKSSDKK